MPLDVRAASCRDCTPLDVHAASCGDCTPLDVHVVVIHQLKQSTPSLCLCQESHLRYAFVRGWGVGGRFTPCSYCKYKLTE